MNNGQSRTRMLNLTSKKDWIHCVSELLLFKEVFVYGTNLLILDPKYKGDSDMLNVVKII